MRTRSLRITTPDLDLRYGALTVRTRSHDVGGVTSRDIDLAREASRLAAERGATAEPASVQSFEVALDTPDIAAIAPFWRAVYGVRADAGKSDEVADTKGDLPYLWFQTCESDEGPSGRMRFHLDITVPREIAEERVAAAVAAGGELVTDQYAPAFWVLADAEGNKACICTAYGRE